MSSYETKYKTHSYSMENYETSDSSSSSPQAHFSTLLKTRDSYPTPSTDSSNEPDESSYVYQSNNLNPYDPYKCK